MKTSVSILILIVAVVAGWFVISTAPEKTNTEEQMQMEELKISASISINPEIPQAGEKTVVTFGFNDEEGTPVTDLMTHHARKVHVLLVSENLETFGHVHSEDFIELNESILEEGKFAIEYTFPESGNYIIALDAQTMQQVLAEKFIVSVEGSPEMEILAEVNMSTEKCFQGYQEDGNDRYVEPVFIQDAETDCTEGYSVALETPLLISGVEATLHYSFEKDGEEVINLEPFLDAGIHFAIISEDLSTILHRHGEPDVHEEELMEDTHMEEMEEMEVTKEVMEDIHMEEDHAHVSSTPDSFGPDLVSENIIFPNPGKYHIFSQVKHEGEIIFSKFVVVVE